jgi:hypothetical protein
MKDVVERGFLEVLDSVASTTGRSLKRSAAELAVFAAERAVHLASIVGQPGYDEAVRAETNAVMYEAGIQAIGEADAVDARLIGAIESGIRFSALMLA